MKRTAIILGIAAAMGVVPSVAAAGNSAAQHKSQVVVLIVKPQPVSYLIVKPQPVNYQRVSVARVTSHTISVLNISPHRAHVR